jgi:hypothetical protein
VCHVLTKTAGRLRGVRRETHFLFLFFDNRINTLPKSHNRTRNNDVVSLLLSNTPANIEHFVSVGESHESLPDGKQPGTTFRPLPFPAFLDCALVMSPTRRALEPVSHKPLSGRSDPDGAFAQTIASQDAKHAHQYSSHLAKQTRDLYTGLRRGKGEHRIHSASSLPERGGILPELLLHNANRADTSRSTTAHTTVQHAVTQQGHNAIALLYATRTATQHAAQHRNKTQRLNHRTRDNRRRCTHTERDTTTRPPGTHASYFK